MLLQQLNACYRFVNSSSLALHSFGTMNSIPCLKNPNLSLLAKLRKEYVSLTNRNQHAWPPTGPKMASASGSSRNTAHAPPPNHSAAPPGGKSHYAPIEGEALAVADSLDKARFFVLGCSDLTIAVDHKPLLKILGNRLVEDIPNGRLRNLKEKTLRYRFKIVHIPGVKHLAADALSRHPTGSTNPDKMLLPDDVAATTESTAQFPFNNPGHLLLAGIRCQEPPNTPTSDDQLASSASAPLNTMTVTWDRVKLATTSDHDMIQLISTIESGFPQFKHQLPPNLREYHQFCDHLRPSLVIRRVTFTRE